MPSVVGRLRPSLHEGYELIAHVDEGGPGQPPAQGLLEHPAVEGERLLDVADLERDVVDSHEARPGHAVSVRLPRAASAPSEHP